MSTSKEKIAERLKLARLQMKITQENFGIPINLLQNNVKDIETGKKIVTSALAFQIEKVHGINFRWLLTGEGEMFVKGKDEAQAVHVAGDVSVSGSSNIVNANRGSVMIRNGHEKLPSAEGAELLHVSKGDAAAPDGYTQALSYEAGELLRLYNSMDIKSRLELLNKAISLTYARQSKEE